MCDGVLGWKHVLVRGGAKDGSPGAEGSTALWKMSAEEARPERPVDGLKERKRGSGRNSKIKGTGARGVESLPSEYRLLGRPNPSGNVSDDETDAAAYESYADIRKNMAKRVNEKKYRRPDHRRFKKRLDKAKLNAKRKKVKQKKMEAEVNAIDRDFKVLQNYWDLGGSHVHLMTKERMLYWGTMRRTYKLAYRARTRQKYVEKMRMQREYEMKLKIRKRRSRN